MAKINFVFFLENVDRGHENGSRRQGLLLG